ncbi:peptidase M23 [Poseidonocella sedimentorum]|uniref:Peptidase M23 n=1 Tax=Poseidonocella sedimentorum TaxID=871652 RepID=A0A1I6CMW0_9RHOB|nr:peptidase M23 [Poseidonocella sedimentorum]SFQ94517.1 hypothetical protein SAMN04515673_10135 [Poseidonocella sedimentorum]
MTRILAATLIPALAAAPALAHSGPHLHPHGIDAAWIVAAVALAALAAVVWFRR